MNSSTNGLAHSSNSLEFSFISSRDPPPYPTDIALGQTSDGGSTRSAFSTRAGLDTPPPVYLPRGSETTLLPLYAPPGQVLEQGQVGRENANQTGCAANWPATRTKILKGLAALGLVVGLLTVAVVVAKFDHEPDPPR
ncbi:hypothetical protein EYR40_010183 [Pleurotus pulmonarius]|nr:hypothetical protein EYR36_010421 [Pleurotus pulmonarius]KAF4588630.1 hypothetical protein EYR40_010183 [Pleurotus pulmonarius]